MAISAPVNPINPPPATEYQGLNSMTGGYDLGWASLEEAEAGTETAKMMSPATTMAAIESIVGDIDAALDAINGATI